MELPFRLNPHLTIDQWLPTEYGFHIEGHNDSNDHRFAVSALVENSPESGTIRIRYDRGLKQATCFLVESASLEGQASQGSRLVVTEHYPHIDDPQDPRVAEVDRSLVPWVAALRRHLLARVRWGWVPGWRTWNERFMPAMPPRQQRIVRLILWISLLEFLAFVLIVALWRLFS